MEKKLLLLGVLRDHEMHGYQLNEMLAESGELPVKLTRPNAYKLLSKMEQDGWITYREEQEGNRPPRRVYQITDTGESAFQQMLRDSLEAYSTPEFPGAVGINFLELLPPDEAIALLQERRDKVATHLAGMEKIPIEMREKHLGMEYLLRFFRSEIDWIDEIIDRLTGA